MPDIVTESREFVAGVWGLDPIVNTLCDRVEALCVEVERTRAGISGVVPYLENLHRYHDAVMMGKAAASDLMKLLPMPEPATDGECAKVAAQNGEVQS